MKLKWRLHWCLTKILLAIPATFPREAQSRQSGPTLGTRFVLGLLATFRGRAFRLMAFRCKSKRLKLKDLRCGT
ncbi:hypothetical protein BDZ97DRAFT_1800934 [Flammula alnicola]|nr:hypothetical protein BDZ97DRAFT_1800934 [Flammula alnicola]